MAVEGPIETVAECVERLRLARIWTEALSDQVAAVRLLHKSIGVCLPDDFARLLDDLLPRLPYNDREAA